MNKLLTIAIPTFNRAQFLDQQLTWLCKAIKGYESECEILISDNCSTDNTQEVIKKWQPTFSLTTFQLNRHSNNIGLMSNLAYCLSAATSKYVWVIGDDDPIQVQTLGYVVNNLKQHPDLSLLILNFARRYVPTNEVSERSFILDKEEFSTNGKVVIERYVKQQYEVLGFMTAQVYRAEAAQQALQNWRSGVNNREAQIYWTAFCALKGSIKITQDVYLEYACGMNSIPEPKQWFKMRYWDLPEVYVKLMTIGYSQEICRKFLLNHFAETNWKVILGALKRWPLFTIKTLLAYFGVVIESATKLLLQSQHRNASLS
ncbi:glycosyltransferase family 2 protein [Iningainema tapete]|uniref:Glycosyltransferase family 2 protein n=1 Tax=Iningainema tapete BLCC-T55 TaxID=2748662 RepID=A0A8J6Y2G6_9CYAN|nr:glycosyltransferase family 2 protein [Iningainema tapete]MBD2778273.1 glycosyltransferase family 2 protein [Iningainema tapete BLCC-T55]